MRTLPVEYRFSNIVLPGLVVFLSGASALTYEVVWQREMFHVFGASAPATAAILSAMFIGIAFGSRLSRRFFAQVRQPILLLAGLEGAIAFWGILVPSATVFSESIYVSAAHALGEESTLLKISRFALAVLPVLPATLCMGATIPVMVRALGRGQSSSVAWIYGLNTLGAVGGALATGLVWIRVVGLSESAMIAIGLNLAVVVLLLLLMRSAPATDAKPTASLSEGKPIGSYPLLGSMYFTAGFVALGLEVVWLRFLGIVNSNSTITFSLTLAIYLCGTGAGSLFVYRIFRRYLSPYTTFAVANGGVALTSLATFRVIYAAPFFSRTGIEIPAIAGTLTLADLYRTEALIIFLLLFVPAVFMGMVYPAVCDAVTGNERSRQDWIANAYFRGTLGAVVGTLATSLFMIPLLGLHTSFSMLVITSAVLCVIAFTIGHRGRLRNSAIIVMCLSVLWAVAIAVDSRPALRNTVARNIDDQWMEFTPGIDSKAFAEIVRFKAGASGTAITKRETRSDDYLVYVDDQLVASTNLEAKVDALMLAHLPLLLHPDPVNELTVGFGTGGTSHAITTHGIQAYCVEIEPEVPRAAHFVASQNYGVLDNPGFQLIINDARDHLKITQRKYDVIATDVTNLQYKQNSSLYTVEYFQLMNESLSPRGVACAWIPMAAIAKRELQVLMKSFQHVFPHATLWFMNHTHTNFGILIGTPGPLVIDYSRLEDGFRSDTTRESLNEIGLTEPMQIVHCLHLDEDGYSRFCGDVPLHTDNNPTLEFSSPLSFYQYEETFCDNLSSQLRYRPDRFQPFVVNGPDDDSDVWERHRVASYAGCEVILSMYQFRTMWLRGQTNAAMQKLKEAIETAKIGMDAWPDDRAREAFYFDFFNDANRRVTSRIR
ncbi:MAG: hypothetical protein GY903_15650 [Fuerstiella sp.]|nr:hypothetical protein [Fuerstiella sp.]MCP4855916.1 hypothetical protein [Fuerstiella sp.]